MPVSQAFLYKDGKAELFLETEVEAKMAEGWSDCPNPEPPSTADEPTAADVSQTHGLGAEPESPTVVLETKTASDPGEPTPAAQPMTAGQATDPKAPKPKRKRRTKAEMEAARAAENPCQPEQK